MVLSLLNHHPYNLEVNAKLIVPNYTRLFTPKNTNGNFITTGKIFLTVLLYLKSFSGRVTPHFCCCKNGISRSRIKWVPQKSLLNLQPFCLLLNKFLLFLVYEWGRVIYLVTNLFSIIAYPRGEVSSNLPPSPVPCTMGLWVYL